MRWILLFLTCLSAFAADPLPTGFRITWEPGVHGGIPTNGIIYTNVVVTNGITASTLQTLLNSASTAGIADGTNRVVWLNFTNTLMVNATVDIPDRAILRGCTNGIGMTNTIIKGVSGGVSGSGIIRFDDGFNDTAFSAATPIGITAPAKGVTNITASANHNLTAGDLVLIDMLEQPTGDPPVDNSGSLGTCTWCGRTSGTRPIGQLVEVLSTPSATAFTFRPATYWNYTNTPQIVEMNAWSRYAGLENITIDNLSSAEDDTIWYYGSMDCWMYRVQVKGNQKKSVRIYNALRYEIRECHIIGGIPIGNDRDAQYTSDRGYGPFLGPHASAGLITDTILEKLTMGVAFEGCAAGNVVSYCLMTNIWWRNDGGTSPRRFGPLMHGPHPFMNLVEGNYSAGRVRHDEYWGTSSHFTYFRNRVIQVDRGPDDAQSSVVEYERKNWYMNTIGNLLGGNEAGGAEDNYEFSFSETRDHEGKSTTWILGYTSIGLGQNDALYDTNMMATLIRWGNWCHRTNDSVSGSGITWHTNQVADVSNLTNFVSSYYLAGEPDSFGHLRWPPYEITDPTRNSATNIPAGHFYYLGSWPAAAEEGGGEPPAGPPNPVTTGTVGGSVSFGGGVTVQ